MASWQANLTNFFLRVVLKRDIDPHEEVGPIRTRIENFLAKRSAEVPYDVSLSKVDANGVPGDWIELNNVTTTRVIYYLHGGGYMICSPVTHRRMVISLARHAQAKSLVLDYRLAPEHPFPAPVEDALKGYQYLLDQGHKPEDITISGDSAGGGLTLALMLKLKEVGLPLPGAACVFSPWTDLTHSGFSMLTNKAKDPYLSPQGTLLAVHHYLQGEISSNVLASPLFGDLADLPPMMIQVGSLEILLDDSRRLAEKIEKLGGEVRLDVWKDMAHVWQAFFYLPEAKLALEQMGLFIRDKTGTVDKSLQEAAE